MKRIEVDNRLQWPGGRGLPCSYTSLPEGNLSTLGIDSNLLSSSLLVVVLVGGEDGGRLHLGKQLGLVKAVLDLLM